MTANHESPRGPLNDGGDLADCRVQAFAGSDRLPTVSKGLTKVIARRRGVGHWMAKVPRNSY